MKLCVAILISCMVAITLAQEEKYTTKFDNINLDDILASDRLLQNYVNCLKGSGKCTPDGSELKRLLPDALETGCTKCSDTQRDGSKKVITHLINKRPNMWKELESQYDPTGKYKIKYEKDYAELSN